MRSLRTLRSGRVRRVRRLRQPAGTGAPPLTRPPSMFDWIADPSRVGRPRDPDRPRDRPRNRQHHLYLDPHRPAPRAPAGPGADDRARAWRWGCGSSSSSRSRGSWGSRPSCSTWPTGSPSWPSWQPVGDAVRDNVGHGAEAGDGSPTAITGRDLILLLGGFFLVGKATHEIHHKLEGDGEHAAEKPKAVSFTSVLDPDRAPRPRVLARLGDHGPSGWPRTSPS